MVVANQGREAQQVGAQEAQPKGGRWLWLEQWALPEFGNVDLALARKLANKGYTKHHCPKAFDERDVKRFSRTKIQVYFMKPNVAGEDRPRLVDREN